MWKEGINETQKEISSLKNVLRISSDILRDIEEINNKILWIINSDVIKDPEDSEINESTDLSKEKWLFFMW